MIVRIPGTGLIAIVDRLLAARHDVGTPAIGALHNGKGISAALDLTVAIGLVEVRFCPAD